MSTSAPRSFPSLTPLAFDPSHPFPHISNLSLNLAVVVDDDSGYQRFARLKVPRTFPRLLPLPGEARFESRGKRRFVWLEQVVAANLDLLFPGVTIQAAYPFRVTRDADFEIELDEASDLMTAMSEGLERRHFGEAVRLEVDDTMPEQILGILERNLSLQHYQGLSTRGCTRACRSG